MRHNSSMDDTTLQHSRDHATALADLLPHLAQALRDSLHCELTLSADATATLDANAARAQLPARAVVASLGRSEHAPALLLLDEAAARHALAAQRPAATHTAAPPPRAFNDKERDILAGLAATLAAPLAALAQTADAIEPYKDLQPGGTLFVDNAAFEGRSDPLGAGTWLRTELRIKDGEHQHHAVLLVPQSWFPEAAAAAPQSNDAQRVLVYCIGDENSAAMLHRVLPDATVVRLADTGELVRQLETGACPALVMAALTNGGDPALQTLAALKSHPQMPRHGLYVRLAAPLRTHVVHCGRLGLVNVLAPDADETTLRARLGAALAQWQRDLKAAD